MLYTTTIPSPLGPLLLASDGQALCGLWLGQRRYCDQVLAEGARENAALPVFGQARRWLDAYFAGQQPSPTALPLAPRGSAFRQQVWRLLLEIPYGQVTTYGELARQLSAGTGRPMASQAVGGAVGHNPVSIIIPCHRVVGSGGSLTGYGGGIQNKVWLLRHEGLAMEQFTIPTKGTAL